MTTPSTKAELRVAAVVRAKARGAGAATRRGIELALKQGADVIVTLDGDGQHNPLEIPTVVQPILDGHADMVIGSRFLIPGYKIRRYRKFGIDVITQVLNFGAKVKFVDGQCCFRAYTRDALERMEITERGFSFSVEMLVKARHLKLRIEEVPVSCIYHPDLESNSTLNPLQHGIPLLFRTIWWRLWEIAHRWDRR